MNIQNSSPEVILHKWQQLAESEVDKDGAFQGSIKWSISGSGGGSWMLRVGIAPSTTQADCEVALSADDLRAIAAGKLNPQHAFLSGRLRIAGDQRAAFKLNLVFDSFQRLT